MSCLKIFHSDIVSDVLFQSQMVKCIFSGIERRGQIEVTIQYQDFYIRILAHQTGKVLTRIWNKQTSIVSVFLTAEIPFESFGCISIYFIIQILVYFQFGIKIIHERSYISRADL